MNQSSHGSDDAQDPLQRDAHLVTRAMAGDDAAFEELISHYHRMVGAQASAVLHDPELIDDCVQESFLTAYRKLATLQDARRFGPWLKTITLRACIATAEKEARRYHRELTGCDAGVDDPWLEEPGSEAESVQAWVDGVRAAVAGLSGPQQDLLYQFYVLGDDIASIAHFLDRPLGTIKRRLHDARASLQRHLAAAETPSGQLAAHRIMEALAQALTQQQQQSGESS